MEKNNKCLKELSDWIREQENPTNIRCDGGWKTVTAWFLLKHLEKNYNISKK